MVLKCPKADNWCTSGYETIKTSFQWVINNFNGYPYKTGHKIISSTFGSEKDTKTKWYLEVYPNGQNERSREFVSLFLYLKESNRSEVMAKYNLAIIDSNQRVYKQMATVRKGFEQGKLSAWGFNKFISRSELKNPENQLLPNDMLTIYCDITYFGECQTNSGQNIKLKRSQNSVVEEDIDFCIKLLSAADKYNLDNLKSICEEYIGSQLTVESVSDVLILADNHSAQELKAKAIDFIKKNINEVMKTKGWINVVLRSDLLELF